MTAARAALVAGLYFATGWYGLQLASDVSGTITLIWLPAGIAFTAVYLWGPAMLGAVFVGAFAVNATTGDASLIAAPLIAAGNTTEALVATSVFAALTRWDHAGGEDAGWWFGRLALAAMCGCCVAALVGTSALLATGALPAADELSAWTTWFAGDLAGILIVASAALYVRGTEAA